MTRTARDEVSHLGNHHVIIEDQVALGVRWAKTSDFTRLAPELELVPE